MNTIIWSIILYFLTAIATGLWFGVVIKFIMQIAF